MKLNYSGIGSLKPFPYIVINDFIGSQVVSQINKEWPKRWEKENGKFQKKWNSQKLGKTATELVNSIDLKEIEKIVHIPNLIPDPTLFGAGYHCIPQNGFLKMHCDFNVHPTGLVRRVNMLIYLNEEWDFSWGGDLQLGLEKEATIAPIGGRCVIFETNDTSWHGHPTPLKCPPDIQRRSLALYFYTKPNKTITSHSTIYKKR